MSAHWTASAWRRAPAFTMICRNLGSQRATFGVKVAQVGDRLGPRRCCAAARGMARRVLATFGLGAPLGSREKAFSAKEDIRMITQVTTDHIAIRRWVEARHGLPAKRMAARDYGAALQII